jgi:WxcM-like, C-terminal
MIGSAIKHFPLPKILDKRGNLSVFENDQYFPFEIRTVCWVCTALPLHEEIASGRTSIGQAIIVLTGKLIVLVMDGLKECEYAIDDQNNCIFIPSGSWIRIKYCAENTSAFIASNDLHETENPIVQFFQYQQLEEISR